MGWPEENKEITRQNLYIINIYIKLKEKNNFSILLTSEWMFVFMWFYINKSYHNIYISFISKSYQKIITKCVYEQNRKPGARIRVDQWKYQLSRNKVLCSKIKFQGFSIQFNEYKLWIVYEFNKNLSKCKYKKIFH